MVFDTARGVTLMHGGNIVGGSIGNDTWKFNGTDWTPATPAHAPPPRFIPAMAFDSARGVAVRFGGSDGITNFNETWEWNGNDWIERTPPVSPPARYAATMVFDSARGVCVLFGGNRGSGAPADNLDDTWEWNGLNWTRRATTGVPPARAQTSAAYDPARQVTVLFGGLSAGNAIGDTWELTNAPAPTIVQQPLPRDIAVGRSTMFSVLAGAAGPATYRWRRNGVPLSDGVGVSGSLTPVLTIGPASFADNGAVFDVVVNSPCGWTLSASAMLTVSELCPVDFDRNGAVNVQDIFRFLSAWFAGCQ